MHDYTAAAVSRATYVGVGGESAFSKCLFYAVECHTNCSEHLTKKSSGKYTSQTLVCNMQLLSFYHKISEQYFDLI